MSLRDRLPALLASQNAAAEAVPEFKPYASVEQSDVAECARDVADARARRATEVEFINGAVCRRGAELGGARHFRELGGFRLLHHACTVRTRLEFAPRSRFDGARDDRYGGLEAHTDEHDAGVGVLLRDVERVDLDAPASLKDSAELKAVAHDIAMHIAAARPTYLKREEVPEAELEHEKEINRNIALNEEKPKPAAVIEKMLVGRIEKFYKEICLLEQLFVKDSSMSITTP